MPSSAAAAGYSGTPLPKKLGMKAGQAALLIAMPDGLVDPSILASLASLEQLAVCPTSKRAVPRGPFDYIHLFTKEDAELARLLPLLRDALQPNGMIWVSWPKKASKVATDVTEDVIRAHALREGLVDIKVCAVDAVWSGLKLVIPRALR